MASSSNTSDSDDSRSGGDSSSSNEDEAPTPNLKEKQRNKNKNAESSDSSSSDESDSGSSSSEEEKAVAQDKKNTGTKQLTKSMTKKQSASSDSNSDSGSGSSSDSSSATPAPVDHTPSSPSAPLSDAGSPNAEPTKKRKIDESGASITTATTTSGRSEFLEKFRGGGKPDRGSRNPNERFQRIKPQAPTAEELEFNNRYEVKTAPRNDYGARAHQDLIVTRGAGFRKEKNKKKRGSYRGGEITVSVLCVCVGVVMDFVWEYRCRVTVSNSRIDATALGGNRLLG